MSYPIQNNAGQVGMGSAVIGGVSVTATAAELNILDGATVTAAELNGLDLSVNGAVRKVKTISITAATDTSENATGWSLPAKAIVHRVYLDVTTAEATATTKTLDVGTLSTDGGDANGYLAAVSTAATGIVKGTLLNTGQTLGALLSVDEDGAGALVAESDVSMGGKQITWTAGEAQTEFAGSIVIEYTEVA